MGVDQSLEQRVMAIAQQYISVDATPEQIRPGTGLAELGINSIKFTHLLLAVEEEFGFESDVEKLRISNYRNLNDLIDYIKTKTNK